MAQPTVNQLLQLKITGTNDVVNAINRVVKSQDRYAKALLRTSKQQKNTQKTSKQLSDQGLANIQAGLVQLSTYLLNMNVKINNVFDSMQKGFAKTETSMNILKTTMGLATKTSEEDLRPFTEASSKISQLALTTEYTKSEIADAFSQMKRDGLSYKDAISVIDKTLQFATASAGLVSLKEASEITTLTFKTLGGDTKDMGKNLNKLFKITQDSSLGVDGLREALSGLRSVSKSFGDSELKESTLLTFLGALMEQGESAANAGLKLKNFGEATTGMYKNLSALQNKMAVGSATRKVNAKNLAILRLAGVFNTKEALDLVNTSYEEVKGKITAKIDGTFTSVEAAVKKNFRKYMPMLNKFAISKLYTVGEDGKASLKSIEDFGESVLTMYKKIKEEQGPLVATTTLSSAFGTEAGSATIKAIQSYLKRRDNIGLTDYAEDINTNLNELGNAQADALKTLEKRIKLSESAESALSEAIFKHDVYAKAGLDTYTELVKATGLLMTNNESLASTTSFLGRGLQLLTGVGTNLGFMLTAAATFSIGLGHAQKTVGNTTRGLGATLGSFGKVFLMPTVAVVAQLAGGLAILGLGVVAVMKYFSDGKSIGEGFGIVLDRVQASAKALGGMFQMMFSDKLAGSSISDKIKEFYGLRKQMTELEGNLQNAGTDDEKTQLKKQKQALYKQQAELNKMLGESGRSGLEMLEAYHLESVSGSLAHVMDTFRSLGNIFSNVAEGMLIPIVGSLGIVFSVLKVAVQTLLVPFEFLAYLFGGANDQASATTAVLKGFGVVLGMIVSTFLIFKTFSFLGSTLTLIGTKFQGLNAKIVSTKGRYDQLTAAINTNSQQQTLNNQQPLPAKQLTFLETLKLKYQALTGQIKDYNGAVRKSTSIADKFNEKKKALKDTFTGLSVGVGVAGGGLMAIGSLMSNLGFEESANSVNKLGMFLLALAPIITLITTLMTALGITTWAAFGWLILGLGAVVGLGYGISSLVSDDKTTSAVSTTEKITTPTVLASNMVTGSNPGSTGSGPFQTPYAPPVANANNGFVSQVSTPSSSQRIEKNVEKEVVIHSLNMTINTDNADEIIDVFSNIQGGSSFATGQTRST